MASRGLYTEIVAANVRTLRRNQELTAEELSALVTEHGGDLARSMISSIETGQRGVSVDELVYLAQALRVDPVALLAPQRRTCGGTPPRGFTCRTCLAAA